MYEAVRAEHFQDLFCRPELLAFARQVITEGYVEAAPGHEKAMRGLMQQAFAILEAASGDERRFQQAAAALVRDVFRKQDPQFWFNQVYSHYKQEIKPQRRFDNLQPWLWGERVLDLGCGDGLTSLALSRHGYRTALTDVLDYRAESARQLPFAPMPDPRLIPYPDGSADSAMLLAMLHHVAARDLLPLLAELRRVSRRVIVEEDSFAPPADLPRWGNQSEDLLAAFTALPVEDQLRYLMFVDTFANAITQGLPQMHMPFNFKPVGEWQELFAGQGFVVRNTLMLGFQNGFFNRSCHVWFVLDRAE